MVRCASNSRERCSSSKSHSYNRDLGKRRLENYHRTPMAAAFSGTDDQQTAVAPYATLRHLPLEGKTQKYACVAHTHSFAAFRHLRDAVAGLVNAHVARLAVHYEVVRLRVESTDVAQVRCLRHFQRSSQRLSGGLGEPMMAITCK